jgi:hypothetical protein
LLPGFLLPSIHSAPPFFTSVRLASSSPRVPDLIAALRSQVAPETIAEFTEQWIRLIMTYARHRGLFYLGVDDAEAAGNNWDEVLRNERIDRASSLATWMGGLTPTSCVCQDVCRLHISAICSPSWFQRGRLHTNRQSRRGQSFCTGDVPKNGQKCCMNGCDSLCYFSLHAHVANHRRRRPGS